ncbi:CRISPR-associated protein Cas5 [Actinomadura sp. 3N508]|uniref:CRISPR-associated protein Cas5 n=1 Tax=Actinomadura sp. 3N508 TaxID=3375153 RepID=UPI0037881267
MRWGAGLRLARAQWAPLVALAVLTLVSALLAVALPARMAAGYDRSAAAAAGSGADVRVEGRAADIAATTSVPSQDALVSHGLTYQQLMPPSLRAVTGQPEASATSDRMGIDGRFSRPRLLYLGWDVGAWERVRIVAGTPSYSFDLKPGEDLRVMVAKTFADRLGYKVGDRIAAAGGTPAEPALRVQITGLYEPVNAADPYWTPRARILHPVRETLGDRDPVEADAGTALIDGAGYAMAARTPGRHFTFSWRFPVRPGAIGASGARDVAADMDAFRSAVQGRTGMFPCAVVTALDDRLDAFAGQLRTAESVLGLVLGGLVAVAAGVLLLAAGLLGERLRPVLWTMRARGASLRQLALPACGLTALAAVPSAALGYAAGRLLDAGPPQSSSIYAVAVPVAAVLTVPVVVVLRERDAGAGSSGRRDDLVSTRPSRRRFVLDALLVALAVIAAVLLRQRGERAGTDPLIAAVPVLLGAALAVLVLRVYPYLLRAAGPFLRRRRGAVAFIGIARASRQTLVGALPLVVLLLAATVAGFAATVETGLRTGQERASWAEVGADGRIEAGPMDEATLARVRAVPGVTGAVRVRVITEVTTQSNTAPLTVVGVDLAAYRKLAPGVPGIPGGAPAALASPLAARTMAPGPATLSRAGMDPIRVQSPGVIEHFPGQSPGSAFVVVPYQAVAGATGFPSQVFLSGDDIDAKKLGAAAPGRGVHLRQDVLRTMTDVPMVTVVRDTFRDGSLIGGAFGLLAVLLVLVVGARARSRTVAHLRALGLARRQSRRLALVEIAPVLLCAVGAGWVLGLLLPEITGPVVDLRPYTGGHAVTAHVPSLPALLGLLGALLLAAAAAVTVDRAFDARPGTVLRTGDS